MGDTMKTTIASGTLQTWALPVLQGMVDKLNRRAAKCAPSGVGPLAAEWKDKPHRLVYDLCTALEQTGIFA